MLLNIGKFALISLFLSSLFSCGNNPQRNTASTPAVAEDSTLEAMQNHPGQRVYEQYCKACHMADGAGIKGIHPPLRGNKTLQDTERLIEVTLKGMTGKITVDGVDYNGIMPPHTHLTNQQIADVLNYVRQSFSVNAEPVTAAEVEKFR